MNTTNATSCVAAVLCAGCSLAGKTLLQKTLYFATRKELFSSPPPCTEYAVSGYYTYRHCSGERTCTLRSNGVRH